MIILFTGNGKGKTSAALGIALRSLGWGKSVCIIQFIKGNKRIGEWKAIKKLSDMPKMGYLIVIKQFIKDEDYFITEDEIKKSRRYKDSCKKAWKFAKESIKSKKYDLIILDEIINAIYYKLIDKEDVLAFIHENSRLICENSKADVILTGRNADKELIKIADIVTEMKDVKHIFKKGVQAKKGIDY